MSTPSKRCAPQETIVRTSVELGNVAKQARIQQGIRQYDVAGLGNTGNRFIVDLENGKPTLQLQKTLDILQLLGLEIVVRPRTAGYA
jgi:y4mF family transcriptional regulator